MTQPSSSAPSTAQSFAFRRRGTQTSRLEAFSDAVFALTLTLLLVSTQVPTTFRELMDKLGGFLPFVLCFVIFITIWSQHFFFFRRYGLTDIGTIVINSALLLVVLFFVYPLKFLFAAVGTDLTFEEARTLFGLYGAGFVAIYALFVLLYVNALRQRAALDLNRVELYDTRSAIWANLGVSAVGIVRYCWPNFPRPSTRRATSTSRSYSRAGARVPSLGGGAVLSSLQSKSVRQTGRALQLRSSRSCINAFGTRCTAGSPGIGEPGTYLWDDLYVTLQY